MAKRTKKKRHIFLKLLIALIMLGAVIWGYAWFYPGSTFGKKTQETVDKAAEKAKELTPVIGEKASEIKESIQERLAEQKAKSKGRLKSAADLNLRQNGSAYDYLFTYNGTDYRAVYLTDTWKIYDSYQITNKQDMKIICQALSDIYPVPSRDGTSVRTADDMAYEWDQHNKIYKIAPEGGRTKERTRNVDLDPEDQGKSYADLYRENLGGGNGS